MSFPIKVCAICGEEFELKPGKPGFANHCPDCSTPEVTDPETKRPRDAEESRIESEANAARRKAIRDLLYRKDS
jgi:DNA-directed RNA polymerase subunit RPC12/RpoP